MNSQDVIARLREYEEALRARGVRHAALFGSVARGTTRSDSDIDIMLDLDIDAVGDMRGDVYDYVGLKDYVASLFPGPVDVVNRAGLKPYLRTPAEAEAIYAF